MQPDNDNDEKIQNEVKINIEKLEEANSQMNDKNQFNLISHATEQQKELIKRAFANDDVEATFEQEKKSLIDEMIPEDLNDTKMPGWGSWGGIGIEQIINPQLEIKREEKRKELEKKALGERKDSHLKHVIINHKRDKKQSKYKLSEVPYPYQSKETYERSVAHPLGKEWNTKSVHSSIIKPRVIKKRGKVIEPINPKEKKKRQKTEE